MQTLQSSSLLQGGKYKIIRFLSCGGFGNTYEGVHTMMDTRVAIKKFFPKMFCNRDKNTSHLTVATQGNRELVDKLGFHRHLQSGGAFLLSEAERAICHSWGL